MRRTLFILAFLALNAFASDCLHTMLNLYIGEEYGIYDKSYEGYVPDSIYYEEKVADIGLLDQIRITKYYRTGRHLDSTMEYFIKPDTTIQELTIYNDTTIIETSRYVKTISIYKDGNLFKKIEVLLKNDHFSYEEITFETFYEGDSSYTTSYLSDIGKYEIRRDTLFDLDAKSAIIVRDPEDENKCYTPFTLDSSSIIFWTYEHEIRGDTLILTQSSPLSDLDGVIYKAFYIYVRPEEETTRIAPKKIYPLADWRKFKQFDLLGRPARGKYTVKLSR